MSNLRYDDSKLQTVNEGSKHQTKYTTLNAKMNNGSKCQTKNTSLNVKLKQTTTLNAKTKILLYGGSECLTKEKHDDSKCRTGDVALNARLKKEKKLITLKTKDEALMFKLN